MNWHNIQVYVIWIRFRKNVSLYLIWQGSSVVPSFTFSGSTTTWTDWFCGLYWHMLLSLWLLFGSLPLSKLSNQWKQHTPITDTQITKPVIKIMITTINRPIWKKSQGTEKSPNMVMLVMVEKRVYLTTNSFKKCYLYVSPIIPISVIGIDKFVFKKLHFKSLENILTNYKHVLYLAVKNFTKYCMHMKHFFATTL